MHAVIVTMNLAKRHNIYKECLLYYIVQAKELYTCIIYIHDCKMSHSHKSTMHAICACGLNTIIKWYNIIFYYCNMVC